jgi:chitinase
MSRATRIRRAWLLACAAAIVLLGSGSSVLAGVTVSLTAPANGATFNAPANITLTASASATGGYTVSKVEFFSGSTLIGADTSSPYSFAWNNVVAGSYTLTAKATATKSGSPTQTATSTVANITVTTPVSVTLTAPTSTQFAPPASVGLTASVVTAQGYVVSKVEFFSGSTLIGTVTSNPYNFNWTSVPQGNYALTAKATATKSGSPDVSATSSATTIRVTVPPVVSITSPLNGAFISIDGSFLPMNVTLSATASDSDGSIAYVDFFWANLNTSFGSGSARVSAAPYTATVELELIEGGIFCPCPYVIWAVAVDNQGASTNAGTIDIVVGPNSPPEVSLTSPTPNATFSAPANITLGAQATDADGSVASVQFFANGISIGVSNATPFNIQWTNVQPGSYALTTVATDNVGATTTSASVPITVNASEAKLFFVHSDHLNTPRLIADAAGTAVWKWDQQEPFGVNVPDENPSGLGAFDFPLRFPGQYADKESGLAYNYHRDYDSILGRYTRSDPIGLRGGLGTYTYVSNQPTRKVDPFGLLDDVVIEPPPTEAPPAPPGDKGDGGNGGHQGGCRLLLTIPLKPPFLFYCIYLCERLNQCPPKRWVEYIVSTWKWGCDEFRPARGPKPGAEPD